MQNAYSKDRNLEVWVGPLTLRNFGNFIKHKNELTEDDLKEFNLLAKCINNLPNEVGKMIMLKYVKLAKFKAYRSRDVKPHDSVYKRYSSRPAPNKLVAEEMQLTVKEISELDKKARHLLAYYMLEELKNEHNLVEEKIVKRVFVNETEIDSIINKYKEKYGEISYEVNKGVGNLYELNLEYHLVFWKRRK